MAEPVVMLFVVWTAVFQRNHALMGAADPCMQRGNLAAHCKV